MITIPLLEPWQPGPAGVQTSGNGDPGLELLQTAEAVWDPSGLPAGVVPSAAQRPAQPVPYGTTAVDLPVPVPHGHVEAQWPGSDAPPSPPFRHGSRGWRLLDGQTEDSGDVIYVDANDTSRIERTENGTLRDGLVAYREWVRQAVGLVNAPASMPLSDQTDDDDGSWLPTTLRGLRPTGPQSVRSCVTSVSNLVPGEANGVNLRRENRTAALYECAEERQMVVHFFSSIGAVPGRTYRWPLVSGLCGGFLPLTGQPCMTPAAASGFLAYNPSTAITTAHSAMAAAASLSTNEFPPFQRFDSDSVPDEGLDDPGGNGGPQLGNVPALTSPSRLGKVCTRGNLDNSVVRDTLAAVFWEGGSPTRQCSDVKSMRIRHNTASAGNFGVWHPRRDWAILSLNDRMRDFQDIFKFTDQSTSDLRGRTVFHFGHPGTRRMEYFALANDTVQCYHGNYPLGRTAVHLDAPYAPVNPVGGMSGGPRIGDPSYVTVGYGGAGAYFPSAGGVSGTPIGPSSPSLLSYRPPCGIHTVKANGRLLDRDLNQGFWYSNVANSAGQSGGPALVFKQQPGAPADGCSPAGSFRAGRTEIVGMVVGIKTDPVSGAGRCLNVGTTCTGSTYINDANAYKDRLRREIASDCSSGVFGLSASGERPCD